MYVTCVIGARPNFPKAAPVIMELERRGHLVSVIHTGQHYDWNLSEAVMKELDIPTPQAWLGVGSTEHRGSRIGQVARGVSRELQARPPDAAVVFGDVDSTYGAAIGIQASGIPLVHVESGLRSYDWAMVEEQNRYYTDHLSDLLLCTTLEAEETCVRESVRGKPVHVGNTMIDSLATIVETVTPEELKALNVSRDEYVLCTFHRPPLVDDDAELGSLILALHGLTNELEHTFLIVAHPRLSKSLKRMNYQPLEKNPLRVVDAVSYRRFIALERYASAVITDSGGVQEETTWLNVPCFTYRDNTERPITVDLGTNTLVGLDPIKLQADVLGLLKANDKPSTKDRPPYWDGRASERAVDAMEAML